MNKEYVYFIKNEDNGLIKIGKTNDIQRRIKDLKNTFFHLGLTTPKLTLINYIETNKPFELECQLHHYFKEQRELGEWFNITEEEVKYVINNFQNLPNINSQEKIKKETNIVCNNNVNDFLINIPNNILYLNNETIPYIYTYLNMRETNIKKTVFSLELLIKQCGKIVNRESGKSLDKFKQGISILEANKYISLDADINKIKSTEIIEGSILPLKEDSFSIHLYNVINIINTDNKIDKIKLINLYYYIISNNISIYQDIDYKNMSKPTLKKYVKILESLF